MKSHRPELVPAPAPKASASAPASGVDLELLELQEALGNAELAARLFQPPAEGEDAGVEAPPGVRAERPAKP